MSVYDERTLRAIGVGLTHREVPIPLYVRCRVLPSTVGNEDLVRIQPRPPHLIYLASLIFQLVDVPKFQR